MLIPKIKIFLNSENVFSIFLVIIILYATLFFIHTINISYNQTVLSHDPESFNDADSIKLYDQLTQDIIRSSVVNKNKTFPGHDVNNVTEVSLDNSDQFINTGDVLSDIPHVKLKINLEEQLPNITDANQTNNNTTKESVAVDGNSIELHKIYKDSIDNKTELIEEKDRINEEKNRYHPHDPFQDVSIRIVKNRTVVSRMLANWTKNEAPSLTRILKRPNYCALWSSKLAGHMDMEEVMNTTVVPNSTRKLIAEGGVFKPIDCSPRERTAIIIPYRDREKNLQVLLAHLHKVLQRQLIEYGIYVIEMAFPTQFNRGLLANVGFLTASSIRSYTCYIIHDVDLLMSDDRNMYRCGRVPRHLTASNSKYSNGLPYLAYFGGVAAFTPEQFWKVNGFSNLYFGWGGEDDDMVYRIFHTGQHFSRPKKFIGGYMAIEHSSDATNPINPNRKRLVRTATGRMSEDGVRSVMYQRLAIEYKPLYTWVYVSAQEAKIMHKYQHFLED